MIGQKWYYVAQIASSYAIKTATIEGETPRKWVLREDDAEEWTRKSIPLGDARNDWSIPKKGEDQREGRGGFRKDSTRAFFASEDLAKAEVQRIQDVRWAEQHAYQIAQQVQYCRDAGLLRKVAEIVGWREESSRG